MSLGDLDPRELDRELSEILGSADAPPSIVYAGTRPRVRARRVALRCRLGWHRWRSRGSAGVDQCVGCGRQRPGR